MPSISAVDSPNPEAPGLWFAFRGSDLLVLLRDGCAEVPVAATLDSLGLAPVRAQLMGTRDGAPCRSAELPVDAPAPQGWTFAGLRSLFAALPEELFRLAGQAFQLVDWERTHLFCGRCGTPTQPKAGERARQCPSCGLLAYPRVSPAIIVSVIDGDRILLVRHRRFPQRFTVVAGFVEPGETLEECVHREVREETGVEVAHVRYVASQSWPFPHSLMVGFAARYAGGELRAEQRELLEARWFTAAELPEVPDRITIARRLIDAFAGRDAEGLRSRERRDACG